MREELRRKSHLISLTVLLSFLSFFALGEGTREIMPVSSEPYYLLINRSGGLNVPFAVFTPNTIAYQPGTVAADYRLNVRICNVGERIRYGFRASQTNTYYRIRRPSDGAIVASGLIPGSGAGYIANYNQAVAGPAGANGVTGGYTALTLTATETGDYYIEFNRGHATDYRNNQTMLQFFDISVVNAANNIVRGRLWSKAWHLADANNAYRGNFYIYSDDSIVTMLNSNGMEPHYFSISCNATGCTDTGNPALDRRSRNGAFLYPQYKIFLNNPDEVCFPTGSFGNLVGNPSVEGCGANRCININVDKPGNIVITLDLNGIPGFQPNTADRQIGYNVVAGANCIPWDGLNGLGVAVIPGFTFTIKVDFMNGITHLPLYDGEDNRNGYIVSLIRPAGPNPRIYWDDTPITAGTATDGIMNLNGCTNATGCHRWRNRGDNACPPCSETLNTWWFAKVDSAQVTYINQVVIVDANTTSPGTGYAANSFNACGINQPIQLNGAVTAPTGVTGVWTSFGDGVFTPNNTTMNATYTPGPNDITNGSVKIKLTSTGGICPPEADSLLITLLPPPDINAGLDKTVCRNNPAVSLSDATRNAATNTITWSGGAGSYLPNTSTINITYTPTAAELAGTHIDLRLVGRGASVCANDTDYVRINFVPAPTANAGPDRTVCANNSVVSAISGTISTGATAAWTSSSGCTSCFSDAASATPDYTPSATDITNGTVTLTLRASVPGCLDVTDDVVITISPAPVVNAGPNQTLCANNAVATLAGTIANAASGTWTSSSGCTTCFSDPNALNGTYTPSVTDSTNGSVTLTLTSNDPACTPVTSTMTITYTSGPTVDAGPTSLTFCADDPRVQLNGTVTGAAGAEWSGGGGTFSPSAQSLNPIYTLHPNEAAIGIVGLYLTTTGNGNCNPAIDSLVLLRVAIPTVNAGPSRTVCANNAVANLAGSVTGANGGVQWSSPTSGTAGFSNSTAVNSTYTLNATDIANGSVVLTLSANSVDPSCAPRTDTMTIMVTPAPTVNAGPDQTGLCFNPGTIALNGYSSTSAGTWSGGAGTFAPNANTLNATYTATATERASGVTLTLTTTNNGNCLAVTDQVAFTFAPEITVDAGANTETCSNNASVTLSGTSPQTGAGAWSGGTGTFTPNANTLNATYVPSAAEIAAGSVSLTLTSTNNGGCTPATDNTTVTINAAPVININGGAADVTICADNPNAALSVTLPPLLGVVWSGGAGTYTPNNTSSSFTYTPTTGEIAAGTVTLVATTTNTGLCNAVTDDITVIITPIPSINAGSDQVLCGTTNTVTLAGTVVNATGGTWTTNGTGTFNNAGSLSAVYTPSAADKASGLVTLTLTSTGNGLCTAVTDQMNISFTIIPSVDAGPDITVCANTLPAQLNGSGTPGTWSGGAGTFAPTAGSMNATYAPTAGEIAAGSVTLTLTSNPAGACPQVSDQVTINISPAPIANAGADITACGNLTIITLSGSVSTEATGGFWSTSGSGTIADPTALNTTYSPSAADRIAGTVTLTLTTTGNGDCAPHADNLVITISPAVTVFAGPDQTVCHDGTGIDLSGLVTGATGGTWSVVTGSGSITNTSSLTDAVYVPHTSDNTVTIRLTTTGNPAGCSPMSDDAVLTLNPIPVVTVSPDQTVCNDVTGITLTGTVTNATGGIWSTTGAGTFTPNSTSLSTTYVPAANETGTFTFTLTSTGNGVCTGVYTAQTEVTITPRPTVNAGPDQTVCANNAAVTLTGNASNATGGTWTTNGDGAFSAISGNGLNATYTPGSGDIATGHVSLTLTTTLSSTCIPVSDIMTVQITPAPTINGGPDRIVCANNNAVVLAATATVVNGGTWSTLGSGNFVNHSNNGLNAIYIPSNADTAAHSVRLVVTSTNNGLCLPVTDTVDVTITPAPIVNAGPDQTICADSFFVNLHARYLHASAGMWITSGTGAFYNNNATYDTATYVPSPADRALGSVTLTFMTTVHGSCSPVSDNLVLTITPAPTVNAGADQTICSDGTSINLTGTKNPVAAGIIWATSGNGTFGSNTSLNTTYTPSTTDKAAGSVVLTLTTTGNGLCRPATDQMILTIVPRPQVNTGLDRTVCADIFDTGIPLTPSVSNYSAVTWTSSGSGAFGPNANTLNATYFPSEADTIARTVTLTLTANGNGPCAQRSDDVIITITPKPIVNAGSDLEVCNGSNAVLNGQVLHAGGGVWTSSGTGTFAPDANVLTATYIPSVADTVAGSVTLTLTSTGMGSCNAVSDQLILNFRNRPLVNAGTDESICADAEGYTISGTVTNASGGVWSSSTGGNFSPSPSNLYTMYFLTPQDIINGQVVLTLTTTGTGTCAPVSDNLVLTITPIPSADAGPASINVCSTAPSVELNGSVTNAEGGLWSTLGDGTFSDEEALSTVYTFGVDDKTHPSVLLTFISQGNGACLFYTDTIRIHFTPTTDVNAGPDRTICRTDFPIQLQGSGTTGLWSGGTASQFSNINSLTSTYMPTAAESAAGSLTLTLSAVSTCAGLPDDVTFTFIDGPSVDVNPLTTICTNVTSINLSGTASSTGVWTSTGSGTFSNTSNINTTYAPSAADRTAGQVRFTFTIPASGFCNAIRDTATIRINPTPVVNAGPDKTRCANALDPVSMNGSYTIASGIQWYSINGAGTFSNPTSVNAVYTPSAADPANTPIRLVMETTGASFCSVQRDTMSVIITAAPTASIGPDTIMCADKTAQLTATNTVATGGVWSTTGTGLFSPSITARTVIYTPSAADTTAGTVTINYITTGNGICAAVSAQKIITLTEKPIVMAGIDDTICSGQDSVALYAAFTANAPSILWTTTGTGTFSPSDTDLNAYYIPSNQDKANGGAIIRLASTGIAECDSVFDYKFLMIIPSPVATVNAGFDQTICRDESFAQLAGAITIATGALWDCAGAPCTGTFLPNDQELFARYYPSTADTAAGTVVLRLTTTTGNGICDPAYDEMTLTIIDIPRIDAGDVQTVCADTAGIHLNGTVTHATLVPVGYAWATSGNGIFTPNAYVANPVYVPSESDKQNGAVTLTLTSTNNGTCQPYSDNVLMTILPQPVISAGIDRITCANITTISFEGTMQHATAASWTHTGTGILTPTSANGLSATYEPSDLDDQTGTVLFTITTTAGLGSCRAVNDQMLLTISPAPTVNAGPDYTVCADNNNITLNSTITVATGVVWSTLGSGNFASYTDLSTTYRPSAADTANHSVQLVLTTTGNGLCNPETDTLTLTIAPQPVVLAGSPIVCEIIDGANLSGLVANAGGGIWTTSGSGSFGPSPTALNGVYYPSQADANAGVVVLTLTSTGNGTCNSVSNTTNLSITRVPTANAGPDDFICVNSNVMLNAVLDPLAVRYQWSQLSGGVINTNTTSLQIVADKDTSFILTVFDQKGCASVQDTVHVRTFAMPAINLSGTSCLTNSSVINSTVVPGLPPVPGIFQWFNNSNTMFGQNTPTLHPTNTGSYTLQFSYRGCDATSPAFVVNPSPTLAGIDKTNCANNATTLTTSSVSGGSSFTYAWDAEPSIISPLDQNHILVVSNLTFDTIAYVVNITNEFSCTTADSVYLISIGRPELHLTNDTVCENQLVTLIAEPSNFNTGNIPPFEDFFPQYTWTHDGTNLNHNDKTLVASLPGQYIVQVSIGECNNTLDTADIIHNRFAHITLPEMTKFCSETDSVATLNATVAAQPGSVLSYLWAPTYETTPIIEANIEGFYFVTVTSTIGSNACAITDSIYVRNLCAPRVFVPNVFTPEQDDANRTFKIFGAHYTNFGITIFNRWGEVIFSSTDLDYMRTDGWDGTYLGKPMPIGVYPYIITYDGAAEEYAGPYRKEGEVMILR
jgi:gliding motility-associated-like protein